MENENPNINKKIKVETYAGDMAKVLTENKDGLIKQVIHEEEEKELLKASLSPEAKQNKIFLRVSIVLTVLALTIFSFLLLQREEIYTVEVGPQFTPLVFTDQTEFLEIDGFNRDQVVQSIHNIVANTEVKPGGLEGIYLAENKSVIGLKRFMELMKGNLAIGANTHIQEEFLLGALSGERNVLFLLLKMNSMADAFNELRAWEEKIFSDLSSVFGVDTSRDLNYLYSADFEDSFVQNKNARVLYGRDRQVILMYVFLDDTSVLVTNSESAVREVILRLTSSQIRK